MKRLILDTNLFILLIAGRANSAFPEGHKRLKGYGRADFNLLYEFVAAHDRVQFTPHVLAETSNLLVSGLLEPLRSDVMRELRGQIERGEELASPSVAAAARPEFLWLGLTDAGLIEATKNGALLLTDDEPLYVAVIRHRGRAQLFSILKDDL